jgi:hypothetical protein
LEPSDFSVEAAKKFANAVRKDLADLTKMEGDFEIAFAGERSEKVARCIRALSKF